MAFDQKVIFLYILFLIRNSNHLRLLRKKGGPMDPKLVRQFIIFLVILFGWTAVALLIGWK